MYTIIDKSLSIFGTFEINEDRAKAISQKFTDLKLATGKDQNGDFVARLQDPTGKAGVVINLSHHRLDYFLGSFGADNRQDLLKMIDGLVLLLDEIKDYGINRLAYNARAFIEDSNDAKRLKLASMVKLLKTEKESIETQIRLNYIEKVFDEEVNNVISVQDARVKPKNGNSEFVKSLILATDVNTVANKNEVRFDKDSLEMYFEGLMKLSEKSFLDLDELLA